MQPWTDRALGHLEVIRRLKIEPVLGRLSERAPEEQCEFRVHGTRPLYDMGNSHGRDTDGACELRLRKAKLFERLA